MEHRVTTEPLVFRDGRVYDVLACRVEAGAAANAGGAGVNSASAGGRTRCVMELQERRGQTYLEFYVATPDELNGATGAVLVQRARSRVLDYLRMHRHPVACWREPRAVFIE